MPPERITYGGKRKEGGDEANTRHFGLMNSSHAAPQVGRDGKSIAYFPANSSDADVWTRWNWNYNDIQAHRVESSRLIQSGFSAMSGFPSLSDW